MASAECSNGRIEGKEVYDCSDLGGNTCTTGASSFTISALTWVWANFNS